MRRSWKPVDLRIIEGFWEIIINERNPSSTITPRSCATSILAVVRLSVTERTREKFP